jgi:hypothetical protein
VTCSSCQGTRRRRHRKKTSSETRFRGGFQATDKQLDWERTNGRSCLVVRAVGRDEYRALPPTRWVICPATIRRPAAFPRRTRLRRVRHRSPAASMLVFIRPEWARPYGSRGITEDLPCSASSSTLSSSTPLCRCRWSGDADARRMSLLCGLRMRGHCWPAPTARDHRSAKSRVCSWLWSCFFLPALTRRAPGGSPVFCRLVVL